MFDKTTFLWSENMPAKSNWDGPGDVLGSRSLFATCMAGRIPPCPELWQQTHLTGPTEKSAEEKRIEDVVLVKGVGRSNPVGILRMLVTDCVSPP